MLKLYFNVFNKTFIRFLFSLLVAFSANTRAQADLQQAKEQLKKLELSSAEIQKDNKLIEQAYDLLEKRLKALQSRFNAVKACTYAAESPFMRDSLQGLSDTQKMNLKIDRKRLPYRDWTGDPLEGL